MNREIKFRFWGKALKPPQFIDLSEFIDLSGWRIFTNTGEEILNGSFGLFNNSLIIPQQYTGLKDKNGKEFYEGDILLWENPNDGEPVTVSIKRGQIFFDNSPAAWAFECVYGSDSYTENGFPEKLDLTIIGNIFENPELLKK